MKIKISIYIFCDLLETYPLGPGAVGPNNVINNFLVMGFNQINCYNYRVVLEVCVDLLNKK